MKIIVYDDNVVIKDSFPDNIQILDSYPIWNPIKMKKILSFIIGKRDISIANRSMFSYIIEWYMHNIGYYAFNFLYLLTDNEFIKKQKDRCKNVDLQKH